MKILFVEDEVTALTIGRMTLMSDGHQVTSARNGDEGISVLSRQAFDAVITDWMMPGKNGIELIRWIRSNVRPVPLLIMSTALGLPDAYVTAFEAGADDYITKPVSPVQLRQALANAERKRNQHTTSIASVPSRISATTKPGFWGVGIGAGTGGAASLRTLFRPLQANIPAAFFVVVHGPTWAVEALSEQLSSETHLSVQIGTNGMRVATGTVVLAPGDQHMSLSPDGRTIQLNNSEPENFARPAVDPILRSLAVSFGPKAIAVVLGGASCDGTIGAGYVRAAGGSVLVQDPQEALVPQMPQNVITLGLADRTLSLNSICRELGALSRSSSTSTSGDRPSGGAR